MLSKLPRLILEELGLVTLFSSPLDTKLLCIQRLVRLFAYGSSTLILVAYLDELSVSKTRTGLFMTLTLAGDTLISFFLTLFADGVGRKAILAGGALLMAGSGVVFATCGNYWVLLAAAILGVISPSGNEIGPFRAIEESTLAQLTPPAKRGEIYAWYAMMGTMGTALGMMVTGWLIHYMREELKWSILKSYRAVFWGYAGFAILKFLLAMALSPAVEAERKEMPVADPETAPLLGDGAEDLGPKPRKASIRSLLPNISAESKVIVLNLCILFALDSFASGLVSLSWIIFYFQDKFKLREEQVGSVFFVSCMILAVSMLAGASIAKRFGNIKTMVFTHLPSSILLTLIPVPSTLAPALAILFVRACTQSMDIGPRAAFLAAVVLPQERTAIMGLINVVKTAAQCLGPLLSGYWAGRGMIGWSFVLAGSSKVAYDLGILAVFAGHKTHEDRAEEARSADEEREREAEAEAQAEAEAEAEAEGERRRGRENIEGIVQR